MKGLVLMRTSTQNHNDLVHKMTFDNSNNPEVTMLMPSNTKYTAHRDSQASFEAALYMNFDRSFKISMFHMELKQ